MGRIGLGFHAPAVLQQPGFRLSAIVDPVESRRTEAAQLWNIPTYPDIKRLLESEKVDLIVIASPTPFHAEQTTTALAAGAHVVCDKPAATSLPEFDAMCSAATAARRHLIIYQPARLEPEIRTLKTILQRGVLGRIHTISRHRGHFCRRNDWQSLQANGGGMLNNFGAHAIDEILWLLDSPEIASVYCVSDRINSAGDADDHTQVRLRSATGLTINLTFSQAIAMTPFPWQVHGSCGSALWNPADQTWHLRYFDESSTPRPSLQTDFAAPNRSYQNEVIHWQESKLPASGAAVDFYAAVHATLAQSEAPPVTLDESRSLLELIERCRKSANRGTPC